MLVLSRRIGEEIVLPDSGVTIEVVRIARSRIWLGITAPPTIPVHRSETWRRIRESGRSKPKTDGGRAKAIRVLIADPDRALLASYRKALCENGFEVETAADGLDCISRLRDSAPDVLVLDPQLPWGGGSGVLALMREEPGVPLVPVLIHASKQGSLAFHDTASPVSRCELKPLTPLQLGSRIRDLVRHSPRRTTLNRPAPPEPNLNGQLARRIAQRTGGRISSLRIEAANGRVVVHGRTPSYYARQLAQAAVLDALKAWSPDQRRDVEFDIEVVT